MAGIAEGSRGMTIWKRLLKPRAVDVKANREAIERSKEIQRRVERQWPEVHAHHDFVMRLLQENHLAPKIRRAIRETR